MLPAWHPEKFKTRAATLAIRQRVIRTIRRYFESQAFAEVDTPILQVSPGNEVHLQTFHTELRSYSESELKKRYLHTSPEFAMKKLLVAGVPRLFQLAHVFRNGEVSSRHHPEFMMLEWYRANAGISEIMVDCEDLVRAVATALNQTSFVMQAMRCDIFLEWERLTVADAFARYAQIDILATTKANPLVPDRDALATQARGQNVRVSENDRWEDIFFRIMGEIIEPHLGQARPTFLYDYPLSQAVLARPNPKNALVAERFELYLGGLELANAFGELTDADEQRRRFEVDMGLREQLYGERTPIDDDFLNALQFGMPESAGIALGVDRLVMIASGAEHIDDVLWLPVT